MATVTVRVVNTPPLARADAGTTPPATPVTVAATANDTDRNGDALTVSDVAASGHGTVAFDRIVGTVTYTPDAAWVGIDTFAYTIEDGRGGSSSAPLTITTLDAFPMAVADEAATPPQHGQDHQRPPRRHRPERRRRIPGVGRRRLGFGRDRRHRRSGHPGADGRPLHPADRLHRHGHLHLRDRRLQGGTARGTVTVTVPNNGRGGSDRATVTVTVTDADPVALADLAATSHAKPVTVPVLANDFDPNPTDALRVVPAGLSDPLSGTPFPGTAATGTVTLNADNTITYSPPTGFAGVVSFTYQVTDGNPGTATPTATVTVTVANAKPVPAPDTATTGRATPVDIDVTKNDTDANGDRLRVIGLSGGTEGGSVSEIASGGVTFTPRAGFTGTDTFTYTVDDGHGGQESASVTVTVPNEAPVAADDTVNLGSDDEGRAIPVLANDTDPSNDPLTVARIVGEPLHGTVAVRDDGSILYTPDAGYAGPDHFTYEVSDGRDGLAVATVSIDVANAPPGAGDDDAATGAALPVVIRVLDNDFDPNPGDVIVVVPDSLTPPLDDQARVTGAVVLNSPAPAGSGGSDGTRAAFVSQAAGPDGTLTYTPPSGFVGAVTFSYAVSDGSPGGTSDAAVVTIDVNNVAPTAVDDHAGAADTIQNVRLGDGLTPLWVTDPDGDVLGFRLLGDGSLPSGVMLRPDGTFAGAPRTGPPGSLALTWALLSMAVLTRWALRLTRPVD